MEHYYSTIQGWFNFPEFYTEVAKHLPDRGFRFAEVGVWKGQSLAYLAVELVNLGKQGDILAVDTFKGSAEHQRGERDYDPIVDAKHGLQKEFCKNMALGNFAAHGIRIVPWAATSLDTARVIADETMDGVFIDASHDWQAVVADCEAWWPKIKSGGWLCGHDVNWDDVKMGLSVFNKAGHLRIESDRVCWMVAKP